jgi:hypothetical protein
MSATASLSGEREHAVDVAEHDRPLQLGEE